MNLKDLAEMLVYSVNEPRLYRIKGALDKLDAMGVKYYITGSLGMRLLGIVDRIPNDLDIVVDPDQVALLEDLPEITEGQRHSCNRQDIAIGSKYIQRQIGGLPICIFIRAVRAVTEREFMGKYYTVADPGHSIEAKLVILKNRLFISGYDQGKAEQHARDIVSYFEWLHRLTPSSPFYVKKESPSDDLPL